MCEGDDFHTAVRLDASKSRAQLELVPGAPAPEGALAFAWELRGADWRLVDGALDTPVVVVTTAGDRPLFARVVVSNDEGGTARAEVVVAVTRGGECGSSP